MLYSAAMVHLALLLIGANALRPHWRVLTLLGLSCISLGAVLAIDVWNGVDVFTVDVLGVVLFVYGLCGFIAAITIGARKSGPALIRSGVFMVGGAVVYDTPFDHDLTAMAVFGTAFLVDGLIRILTAAFVRFPRWRWAIAGASLEVGLAVVIYAGWPVAHTLAAPFTLGVALAMTGWAMIRMAVQLRDLPDGASVTALPFFSARNWHARDTQLSLEDLSDTWNSQQPLTVCIWTPVRSVADAQRALVVDRYVAAVDRKGVISTGHSALEVRPDLYVSHYPGIEVDHSTRDFSRILRASDENDIPGRFLPSHAEEVADWCPPDRKIQFHRFNEPALRRFWAHYSTDTTYNLTRRNCSSTVAMSLDAAMEGVLGEGRPVRCLMRLFLDPNMYLLALLRGRAESMTWTPGLMLDYATRLELVTQKARA